MVGSGLRLGIYVVAIFSALLTSQNGHRSRQGRRGGGLSRADKSEATLSTPWLERIVLPMKPTLRNEEDLTTHLLLKRVVVDLKSNLGDDSDVKHLAIAEMYFQEKLHFDCEKELMLRTRGGVSSRARARELLKEAKGSIPRAVELWLVAEERQKIEVKNDDETKRNLRERVCREERLQRSRGGRNGDIVKIPSSSSLKPIDRRSMISGQGSYKQRGMGRSSSPSASRFFSERANSRARGEDNFAGIFDEGGRDLREMDENAFGEREEVKEERRHQGRRGGGTKASREKTTMGRYSPKGLPPPCTTRKEGLPPCTTRKDESPGSGKTSTRIHSAFDTKLLARSLCAEGNASPPTNPAVSTAAKPTAPCGTVAGQCGALQKGAAASTVVNDNGHEDEWKA